MGLQVRAAIVSEQANAVTIAALADPKVQAHARNALLSLACGSQSWPASSYRPPM